MIQRLLDPATFATFQQILTNKSSGKYKIGSIKATPSKICEQGKSCWGFFKKKNEYVVTPKKETLQECINLKGLAKHQLKLFSRQPSDLEIWSTVCANVWFPFLYVWDIVKDTAQLLLMVNVVGGYENVFKYWPSFSSVVRHIRRNKLSMNI